MFPKKLSNDLFNDIVNIYLPIIVEESDGIKILKLKTKPEQEINQEIYDKIYNKYGIETLFEKISTTENKGINKISFLKNGKPYNDLLPVYIYWDEDLEENKENKKDYTTQIKILNNDKKIAIIKKNKVLPIEKDEKVKEENEIKNFKTISKKDINNKILENNIKVAKKEKEKRKYKIAIIIDDVGYDYKTTYDFLRLGIPLTFAIIPDMKSSKKFYSLINKYNYQSILHIPMEPQKGKNFVEKNAILTEMDDHTIQERISNFINEYPDAIGANNHMGSKAIMDARVMKIIMKELATNNKIWLDSMTTINTVSKEIASIYGIPYYERDVFLDNKKDIESIRESFEILIKEARKKKYAIGIGHIQTENLPSVIKEYYDKRENFDIDFVFLSDIKNM
ncbi:MAG TPA: divergent polysaccharide deacetylase family protein [Spirochaetota bacterium]|nr:divergent polysaccharide deacetylase family protein [Spirochaetota bacterium]HOL57071.1 divergent polysaccharide deacetylase family protein [Spirochaetota bacterium]HPP04659.1 divergent polysaccharide deacetylase family protein [Spirochaetota bacterium]